MRVYGDVAARPSAPSGTPTATPATVAPAGTVDGHLAGPVLPRGQDLAGYELLAEGNGASRPRAPTGADTTTAHRHGRTPATSP